MTEPEQFTSNDNQISSTTDDDFVKVNGDEGQRGDENLNGCNGGAGDPDYEITNGDEELRGQLHEEPVKEVPVERAPTPVSSWPSEPLQEPAVSGASEVVQAEEEFFEAPKEQKREVKKDDIPPAAAAGVKLNNAEDECILGKCVFLSCCNMPSQVCDLILWKDIKRTGAAFGVLFALLLSFILFSLVSVFSYLGIATLLVTISFRVYKSVLSAIQKTNEGNPFTSLLKADFQIKPEQARRFGEQIASHLNCTVNEVRRLFLVEDLVDSLKVLVLLWIGTYIGSWFNTLTLLMLGLVSLFTLPMVYSTYKVQIDTYVGMVREHVTQVTTLITSKIPMLKKEKTH